MCKTNPPTPVAAIAPRRSIAGMGSRCEIRRGEPVQRHATGCNPLQPGATNSANVQNEATDVNSISQHAVLAQAKKKLTRTG